MQAFFILGIVKLLANSGVVAYLCKAFTVQDNHEKARVVKW